MSTKTDMERAEDVANGYDQLRATRPHQYREEFLAAAFGDVRQDERDKIELYVIGTIEQWWADIKSIDSFPLDTAATEYMDEYMANMVISMAEVFSVLRQRHDFGYTGE